MPLPNPTLPERRYCLVAPNIPKAVLPFAPLPSFTDQTAPASFALGPNRAPLRLPVAPLLMPKSAPEGADWACVVPVMMAPRLALPAVCDRLPMRVTLFQG